MCSNYISVELTDIVASLLSVGRDGRRSCASGSPATPLVGGERADARRPGDRGRGRRATRPHEAARAPARGQRARTRAADIIGAYAPYLIIIVVFGLAQWGPIKDFVAKGSTEFAWPGLDILNAKGEAPTAVTYKFNWLPAAGTLLLICGLLTMASCGSRPRAAAHAYGRMLNQLKWATLTVAAVLALAYVMNLSAQTLTIGNWIAGAGGILAFLSPIIGWLGTAVTGSDTSSNSLFGVLQVSAAQGGGARPDAAGGANSSGGVLGKMISPQNLAIGAAAVGLGGSGGRAVPEGHRLEPAPALIMCVLVYLQSTAVLSWMVV